MILKQLELGPMGNFTYILGDKEGGVCAVIDPGWDAKTIKAEAAGLGLRITHILLTHAHFDHAAAAAPLSSDTGATIYVHRAELGDVEGGKKQPFSDGDKINIGGLTLACMHTPGHTPGSTCFLVDNAVFTGDTLFVDAIGRTDLEGGDPEEMFHSLARLSQLPDSMITYTGHNYGREKTSTIGEQKKRNPYMRSRSVGDFLRM